MKKHTLIGLIFSGILWSCGTEETKSTPSFNPVSADATLTVDQRAKRFVENKLGINAAETYKFYAYDANINADTVKDKVFLVQREEFAFEKVERVGSLKNFKDLGYNSNENYIFIYNGARDEFEIAVGIGANITQQIDLKFEPILSPAKNDIVIDYRVGKGLYRAVYAYADNQLLQILSFPLISDLGTENEESFVATYHKGSASIAKDVWLYKADMNYNKDSLKANPNFLPERVSTDKLYLRFIFDPRRFKYVTPGFEQDEDKK